MDSPVNSPCKPRRTLSRGAILLLAAAFLPPAFSLLPETAAEEPQGARSEPLPTIPRPWKKKLSKPPAARAETSSAQEGQALDAPPGQWVELLKRIDPDKHGRSGAWRLADAQLEVHSADSTARLVVPVAPKGSYALRIEFTRTLDGMIGVILPVGQRQCLAAINYRGAANGLDMISGRRADNNQSTFPGVLANDRRYTLEITVRVDDAEAAVTVNLDDRPLVFYRGPVAELGLNNQWSLPHRNCLGLVAQCNAVFHSMKFRSSSGRATILP